MYTFHIYPLSAFVRVKFEKQDKAKYANNIAFCLSPEQNEEFVKNEKKKIEPNAISLM